MNETFEEKFPSLEDFRNTLEDFQHFYQHSNIKPRFFNSHQIMETCIDKKKVIEAINDLEGDK